MTGQLLELLEQQNSVNASTAAALNDLIAGFRSRGEALGSILESLRTQNEAIVQYGEALGRLDTVLKESSKLIADRLDHLDSLVLDLLKAVRALAEDGDDENDKPDDDDFGLFDDTPWGGA